MLKNNFTKFKETEQGLIPEDWELSQLDEIIDFDPPRKIKKGDNIKFVAMTDVNTFNKKISNFTEREFDGGSKFKNGDTLLSRITPCLENGKTAFVDILNENENAGGSTEFIVMSGKRGRSNSEFVYYLAISSDFRKMAIQAMVGTSGRQRVQVDRLKSHQMAIPPLLEQEKIAEVLGALDEKIELNRKMNKTLESLAQAVFKKWFIDDADPNWEMSTIGKELETSLGGTPSREKSEYWNGDIPWINSGKVNEDRIIEPSEYITEQGLKKSATKLLPKGTTVLAITGATLGQYSLLEIDSCFNQSVVGIKESPILKKEYVYFWISQTINDLLGSQTGGAQQHINKQVVDSHGILIPDNRVLENYYKIANPIFEQITDNYFQIQTLSQIRNSLLPRLMSGKLRVK